MLRTVSIAALFSVVLALSGCEPQANGCPPLVAYSPENMKKAAAVLRTLPPDSPLARMIVDYGKMRDACRVPAGLS